MRHEQRVMLRDYRLLRADLHSHKHTATQQDHMFLTPWEIKIEKYYFISLFKLCRFESDCNTNSQLHV